MKKILYLILIITIVICVPLTSFAIDAWPADLGITIASYSEPSGAVWHEERQSLFIVQDPPNSNVIELDASGSTLNTWYVGGDLEGITIANEDIYIAREYPQAILKFDIESGSVRETNDISDTMPGNSSSGLEALTYVDGIGFYAGSQYNGKIYVFDDDFNYKETITPSTSYAADISGLHYHADSKKLFAIYDSYNVLLEMDTSGNINSSYILPGSNQEGVALVESCPNSSTTLFIAEDSGLVNKYENYPVSDSYCSSEETEEEEVAVFPLVENYENGKIKVRYEDGTVNYYTIFSLETDKKTKVKQYKDTNNYLVLDPYGRQLALVDIDSGEVLKNIILGQKINYKYNSLKLFTLRNKNFAVITSKKIKKAKLSLIKININSENLIKKDYKIIYNKNIKTKKTKQKNNTIQIKKKNGKVITSYLITKKYRLKLN